MKWAKTGTRHLKITGFFSVLLLSLLTLATIFHPFASAAYLGDRPLEYGYFYNNYLGGRAWHNVMPGGIPNTADKGTFINYITDRYYNGSQQEKTGAAFIINLQLGNSGSGSNRGLAASDINGWSIRLQQPQVSFSMENYAFTYNSAYDNSDDDLFYFEPDVRLALVIRYNGVVVSVIKQDCANPLDGNSGIPQYVPSWSLSATATANKASMFPGDTTTFNYNLHNNGPDTASFQYVTRVQEYINGVPQPINAVSRPNGDGSWPVPNAVEGGLPGGASEPSYSVRGYTALYNPSLTKVCSWIEYAGRSSTDGTPAASNQACVTINQPVPTCAPLTITPSAIEPGTPFTAYASVTYQSQQAAYWTYQSGGRSFIKITGPGGYNQDLTFSTGSSPTTADISNTFSLPAPTATGVYSVMYGVRGGTIGQITCPGATPGSIKVAYSPYFRAQGGDVLAVVGFGTACTTTTAKITSWNQYTGSATPYYGAGTDLAAIALGQITRFVSGNNQDGTAATNGTQAPNGLTFANTTANVTAGMYGGTYGVTNWCMPDYAGDAATAPGVAAGTTVAAAIAGANGTYTLTGNQTLSGATLSAGKRITIVITGGDLTITGDVTYSYASLAEIPQLQIFVKGGNINIQKTVHNLSGVYGAQKSSAGVGGQIDTCAETPWNFANCNSSLTFYGAIFADKILLKRMAGTVSSPTTSAEIFVYGPETWLGRNFAVPDTAWESATSLSPIL